MYDRFLNCDWGTSRFRLRWVDAADGVVLGQYRSDEGVAQLAAAAAPNARAELFREVLTRSIGELARRLNEDLTDVPVVVSGMASSSIGWRDLPYAALPFALDGRDVVWQDLGDAGVRVILLSGVRSDGDVMRGEETELMGIGSLPACRRLLDEAIILLPGTHSKHVHVVGGRIVAFQTHMTGELFDLLCRHSSLRHSTGQGEGVLDNAGQIDGPLAKAFCEGVQTAQANPLPAALFQVRVRQLLHGGDAASNALFLSGLLIGAEIASLARHEARGCPIVLCANPSLSRPYRMALDALGFGDRLTVIPPEDADRLSALGQATVLQRIAGAASPRIDRLASVAPVRNTFDWARFRRLPIVGILRGFSDEETERLAEAAAAGGVTSIEVTMNTPNAVEQIGRLVRRVGKEVNVGAGTVVTLDDFRAATAAGAAFIVTPTVVPDVIRAGVAAGLPVFAGAMTPSEILEAWRLGAAMVKVFPADQFGPAYLRSIKGPFAQIPLMPTGGINVDTILAYKAAGAEAFGVGSPLFSKSRTAARDWAWVTQQARRFVEALAGHSPGKAP
jgi:Entner-Doudoroff aldolase